MALFKSQQRREPTPESTIDVWPIRDTPNMNVVGESHYARQICQLLPQRLLPGGTEVREPVTVRHDAGNRHDPNAVEVRGRTGTLGFLSREDAARYAPYLASIQRSGRVVATVARVWGADRAGFVGSVRIVLPPPHLLFPVTEAPPRHRLLPLGKTMQVADEDKYLEALVPYLRPEGECWVHASLHAAGTEGRRHVEVRVDGRTVGRLTPKMSSDLLPAIDHFNATDHTCVARAVVKGNQLKAEVTLYVQRAHELDQTWLKGDDLPPPGWHPDPHGMARLRYWDGSEWSSHTAD